MKFSFLHRTVSALVAISLATATSLSLTGCGGGGGGDSEEVQIAPQTLDEVNLILYNAFALTFFKLGGENGNENGAVDYDFLRGPINFGVQDNNVSISNPLEIPVLLRDVTYTYEKTGADTGRIILNYLNTQIYPYNLATQNNNRVVGYELFWNGISNDQTVLDILFVDQGGFITSSTTRNRDLTLFSSFFTGGNGGGASVNYQTIEFDSTNSIFTLNGAALPSNYSKDVSDDEPFGIVWESIQGRTIEFTSGTPRTVAYQSSAGGITEIPNEDGIDDSGTILVDSPSDGVFGRSGEYGYVRTGGADAIFIFNFRRDDGMGGTELQVVNYTLTFDSFDGGTYVSSDGETGEFTQTARGDF